MNCQNTAESWCRQKVKKTISSSVQAEPRCIFLISSVVGMAAAYCGFAGHSMKKYFCKATRSALALSSVGLIASAVTLHAGDDLSGFYLGADAGYNLESDLTAS